MGTDLSITIGADGLPIMSFADTFLQVLHCNDLACSGNGEILKGLAVGRYSSITIGVDGLPIMSFYNEAGGALLVAHCASVYCTAFFRRR